MRVDLEKIVAVVCRHNKYDARYQLLYCTFRQQQHAFDRATCLSSLNSQGQNRETNSTTCYIMTVDTDRHHHSHLHMDHHTASHRQQQNLIKISIINQFNAL